MKKILAIVSVYSVFVGCNLTDIGRHEAGTLVPLSTGNYWSFVQYSYIDGRIIEGLTDSFRINISGQISVFVSGRSYTASLWNSFDITSHKPASYKWLYWNGDDGLYQLGGVTNSDTTLTKILYLKYPVRIGEVWHVPWLVYYPESDKFVVEDTLSYECLAIDDSVQTPAGTFKCIVYHYRIRPQPDVLESWDYYQYFNPSVGLVAVIVKSSLDNSVKFKTLLYDFSVRQQ